MDRWLSNIEADPSHDPLEVKVLRAKPEDAVDACFIEGEKVTDPETCRATFPYYGDPRIAAGGPLAHDVLKCRLMPLRPRDYNVTFTHEQWARLQHAFPHGVCDWRRRGVDQRPSVPWMSFAEGPGGQPLGREPRSRPGPPP